MPYWNGDLKDSNEEKISITVIEDWKIRNLIDFVSRPILFSLVKIIRSNPLVFIGDLKIRDFLCIMS